MSILVPFKAIRPTKESVLDIASRPYDVLNVVEAKEAAEGNPNSFYHVIKPEINFPLDHDYYAPEVYQKGAENFKKLQESGLMVQDGKEHFYI